MPAQNTQIPTTKIFPFAVLSLPMVCSEFDLAAMPPTRRYPSLH